MTNCDFFPTLLYYTILYYTQGKENKVRKHLHTQNGERRRFLDILCNACLMLNTFFGIWVIDFFYHQETMVRYTR